MTLVQLDKNNLVATLKINKPEALNALSSAVLMELDKHLDLILADKELRCVVITGSGDKAFVAGADIKEIHALDQKSASEFAGFGQSVFMKIESLPMPVIAAVKGFALGGGLELAMACDFILASRKARFGLPECTLGLMPGFGGTVRLARRVGPARAKQMTFSGDLLSAEEALRVGLVNEIYDPEELMEGVRIVAKTISLRAPLALASIKKTIQETYGLPTVQAMRMEQKAFGDLFTTKDCKEGTQAFIEKRKPQFFGE